MLTRPYALCRGYWNLSAACTRRSRRLQTQRLGEDNILCSRPPPPLQFLCHQLTRRRARAVWTRAVRREAKVHRERCRPPLDGPCLGSWLRGRRRRQAHANTLATSGRASRRVRTSPRPRAPRTPSPRDTPLSHAGSKPETSGSRRARSPVGRSKAGSASSQKSRGDDIKTHVVRSEKLQQLKKSAMRVNLGIRLAR